MLIRLCFSAPRVHTRAFCCAQRQAERSRTRTNLLSWNLPWQCPISCSAVAYETPVRIGAIEISRNCFMAYACRLPDDTLHSIPCSRTSRWTCSPISRTVTTIFLVRAGVGALRVFGLAVMRRRFPRAPQLLQRMPRAVRPPSRRTRFPDRACSR